MQERRNSSALAMELRLSCINPQMSGDGLTMQGARSSPAMVVTSFNWGPIQYKDAGLSLGLHPANERLRYFVTTSLIGCAANLESALKMPSYWYRNSHHKGTTAPKTSYLYNGNPYTWKNSLYIETGSRIVQAPEYKTTFYLENHLAFPPRDRIDYYYSLATSASGLRLDWNYNYSRL